MHSKEVPASQCQHFMQPHYKHPSKASALFAATDCFPDHRPFALCILFQDLIQILTLHLFSWHLGLLQRWVAQFSPDFHDPETLKSTEWLFCRMPIVGSSYVLSWLHWIYAVMYSPVHWIKGSLGQSVLLQIMLTFILKGVSSSFFPVKLLFFPFATLWR